MTRPFRFGIQAQNAATRKEWVDTVKKAEDLGYSSMTLPDHFDGQLAPAIALQVAADVTTDLRVGALVWCNDYRHPVVFANEMATLDIMSEGRLELGIGAGWMKTDYDAAGMTYDRPGIRIERMIESVTILKGLFADGPFSFQGEHYTITDLDLQPKPIQKPHPPILIGGGGKRMLRNAGKMADIIGINPNMKAGLIDSKTASDATAAKFSEKLGWVKEGAGDRYDDIELNVRVFVMVMTDDPKGMAEMMAPSMGMSAEDALESPLALVGDTQSMANDLLARREQFGFSYIGIGVDEMEQFAPVVAMLSGT